MLRFIVCEDNIEELNTAVQTITKTMMKYDEMEYKIQKFQKYDKKLQEVIKEPFDTKIYMLDVELPIVSGLEIASEIREEDDNSYIVFVTSHPENKNDIFYSRLEAIDFIAKNHKYEERIGETIEHILKKILRNKTLKFSFGHTAYIVLYRYITYIEKDPSGTRCIIHFLNDKPKYIKKPLSKLEKELAPLFIKTHKSCIVNISNISEVEYAKFVIHFKNDETTTLLSPNHRKKLKKYVGSFESIL